MTIQGIETLVTASVTSDKLREALLNPATRRGALAGFDIDPDEADEILAIPEVTKEDFYTAMQALIDRRSQGATSGI